jgi:hypothetical protein
VQGVRAWHGCFDCTLQVRAEYGAYFPFPGAIY